MRKPPGMNCTSSVMQATWGCIFQTSASEPFGRPANVKRTAIYCGISSAVSSSRGVQFLSVCSCIIGHRYLRCQNASRCVTCLPGQWVYADFVCSCSPQIPRMIWDGSRWPTNAGCQSCLTNWGGVRASMISNMSGSCNIFWFVCLPEMPAHRVFAS